MDMGRWEFARISLSVYACLMLAAAAAAALPEAERLLFPKRPPPHLSVYVWLATLARCPSSSSSSAVSLSHSPLSPSLSFRLRPLDLSDRLLPSFERGLGEIIELPIVRIADLICGLRSSS